MSLHDPATCDQCAAVRPAAARGPALGATHWAAGVGFTVLWLLILAACLASGGCSHRGRSCGRWLERPDGSFCRPCEDRGDFIYSECKGSGVRYRTEADPGSPAP